MLNIEGYVYLVSVSKVRLTFIIFNDNPTTEVWLLLFMNIPIMLVIIE